MQAESRRSRWPTSSCRTWPTSPCWRRRSLPQTPALLPYNAKAIGEVPLLAVAPAIANAIRDATGVRMTGPAAYRRACADSAEGASVMLSGA